MRTWLMIAALGLCGAAAPDARPPVAVELFTSQGCSSCPPADAYLEQLARDPSVVAISRPVTYWNRLGWKDTLARAENDRLQRLYAGKDMRGAGVYTPQIVVQGRFGAVGSDRAAVSAHIAAARREIAAAIAVRPDAIGVAGQGAPAEVRLVSVGASRMVRIGSGENASRTVRYTNVVLADQLIGEWQGGARRFAVPRGQVAGADRRAVIVQKKGGGPVLAARWL